MPQAQNRSARVCDQYRCPPWRAAVEFCNAVRSPRQATHERMGSTACQPRSFTPQGGKGGTAAILSIMDQCSSIVIYFSHMLRIWHVNVSNDIAAAANGQIGGLGQGC